MLDSRTWIITELHLLENTVQVKSASTGTCSDEINRLFAIIFTGPDTAVKCKSKIFGQADTYDVSVQTEAKAFQPPARLCS